MGFRIAWDEIMARMHHEQWATVFSEMVMAVLNDLSDNKTDALSVFIEAEKNRVSVDVPMLCLPDAPQL